MTLVTLMSYAFFATAAYITFYKQVVDGDIEANRWGWLIWTGASFAEALTYEGVSGDWLKGALFFFSSACCFVVTVRIWSKVEWEFPTLTEFLTIVAMVIAGVVWFRYHDAWGAHVAMLVAVPVSFIPEWVKAWTKPQSHRPLAWALWTAGDFCALLFVLLRLEDYKELPYALLEFGCHWTMLGVIMLRRGV